MRSYYPWKQYNNRPPKTDMGFPGAVFHDKVCFICGAIFGRIKFRHMVAAIWYFRERASLGPYARPLQISCKKHACKVVANVRFGPLFTVPQ